MTVEILGTKVDDSYVEMVSETVDVIPWETVYVETDELAPGEKQEIQTPYTGYVVQTSRNVYAGDGSLLSSTFEATSNYGSRDQIIRIGKAKPREPNIAPQKQQKSRTHRCGSFLMESIGGAVVSPAPRITGTGRRASPRSGGCGG